MRILVTGAAGFIGSAYVDLVLAGEPADRADDVVALDALTYAGNPANLGHAAEHPRFSFVHGDIADAPLVDDLVRSCDAVVNFAAETHVDRSLADPAAFVRANVAGVVALLDAVRRHGRRMVQVGTDEVYGDVPPGRFSAETDCLRPRSPYAAAKAGGDLMCRAFVDSHGAEVLVTRGCNTIGPRQHPEKLVPLFVTNALRDQPLPVYGDGRQVRDWLHVDDHAAAVDLVLRRGRQGETYNVGAGGGRPNLEVARAILSRLGKPESLIAHVTDRPGHDRRYALDWRKIRDELGWTPTRGADRTLRDTIDWYVAHPEWWEPIRDDDAAFAAYYERQYGPRLARAGAGKADES
ncbi:MAG: dTDP-glucose 4,6-dehydratase [Thermomicrobiales bacterium]